MVKKSKISVIACILFVQAAHAHEPEAIRAVQSMPCIFEAHLSKEWYPSTQKALKKKVKELLAHAHEKYALFTGSDNRGGAPQVRALICPHAGYAYSGIFAAAGYCALDQAETRAHDIDRVIILAPSHTLAFIGIAVPSFTQYQTPLGVIALDEPALRTLTHDMPGASGGCASGGWVSIRDDAFESEHAIEIQLPFIQTVLPHAQIVPIVVGRLLDADVVTLAERLRPLITPKTLVVISTDFTHYGRAFGYVPFTDHVISRIGQLDASIFKTLENQDRIAFQNSIKNTQATVCGYEPLRILLELMHQGAFGPVRLQVASYGTSADVTQDERHVVSYGTLVATQEDTTKSALLNAFEQRELLKYARAVVTQLIKQPDKGELVPPIRTQLLETQKGVFVTLYTIINGEKILRGCIGQVYAHKPLYQTVADMVVKAALHDTRFAPVTKQELSHVAIAISVLEKPHPVPSYKDIVLNQDGIILQSGEKSALFLPKVPEDHGFDLPTTLQQLSLKAGLSQDAWLDAATKFQVFTAQDFSELEFLLH